MNLINKGDILESYTKAKQRGVNYFLSKVNPNPLMRTQSTFNPAKSDGSNWWIISDVKQRENEKVSGDTQKTFDIYMAENYFQNRSDLKLLSIACGVGNREIRMAEGGPFVEVLGIDLSGESINEANQKVRNNQLNNIRFEQADFYSFNIKENYYDVIMFYSSLHHFKNIDLIAQRILKSLKSNGYLVLNEYVGRNRLQFSKEQVWEMNRLLHTIPKEYRTRFMTGHLKNKVYAPVY